MCPQNSQVKLYFLDSLENIFYKLLSSYMNQISSKITIAEYGHDQTLDNIVNMFRYGLINTSEYNCDEIPSSTFVM